ncbi:MAG: hypothetical protein HW380_72 [Magnetococcales bacterium]|nr:hypothetical protein [Magnetococcales bacterium]HIJ83900.1 hypothetical protein [Magnetococcales bacterium]
MEKKVVKSFCINKGGLKGGGLEKSLHPYAGNKSVDMDCSELKRRVDAFHEENKEVIRGAIDMLRGGIA